MCPGVVGGKLDFPRYASFAAIKMILWWEDEYFASYRKHSGLLHTEEELNEGDFVSHISILFLLCRALCVQEVDEDVISNGVLERIRKATNH